MTSGPIPPAFKVSDDIERASPTAGIEASAGMVVDVVVVLGAAVVVAASVVVVSAAVVGADVGRGAGAAAGSASSSKKPNPKRPITMTAAAATRAGISQTNRWLGSIARVSSVTASGGGGTTSVSAVVVGVGGDDAVSTGASPVAVPPNAVSAVSDVAPIMTGMRVWL